MIKLECRIKNPEAKKEDPFEAEMLINIDGCVNIIAHEVKALMAEILNDHPELATAVIQAIKESGCLQELQKEVLKVEN